VQQLAQPPVGQHALDLLQRRLEAPVEADRERHFMLRAHVDDRIAVLFVQREGFLRKDVLAGLRRGADDFDALRVRRRDDDCVDLRIGEHLLIRIVEGKTLLLRVVRRFRHRARRAGDDADPVALALNAVDEILSPAAEADDSCVDHVHPFDSDLSYCD
jgi:hypothetical protein